MRAAMSPVMTCSSGRDTPSAVLESAMAPPPLLDLGPCLGSVPEDTADVKACGGAGGAPNLLGVATCDRLRCTVPTFLICESSATHAALTPLVSSIESFQRSAARSQDLQTNAGK